MISSIVAATIAAVGSAQVPDDGLIQFGSMHETIGQQQHHGRVRLGDVIREPNFFGVGALAELQGEISILDGKPIVTSIDHRGQLRSRNADADSLQATLLVGKRVERWHSVQAEQAIGADEVDQWIGKQAAAIGLDSKQPFPFVIEGEFTDVRLHVINGACPLHSRIKNKPIPERQKPYIRENASLSGTVVGIFARDAVGKLTHPATTIHAHLIFSGEDGEQWTGHLERFGLAAKAKLKLPVAAETR